MATGRRHNADNAQQAALRAAWPSNGAAAAQPMQAKARSNVPLMEGREHVVVGVGLEYQCWSTGARRMVPCQEALALAGGPSLKKNKSTMSLVVPLCCVLGKEQDAVQGEAEMNEEARCDQRRTSLRIMMHRAQGAPRAAWRPSTQRCPCLPAAAGAFGGAPVSFLFSVRDDGAGGPACWPASQIMDDASGNASTVFNTCSAAAAHGTAPG